jgi:DNA primase
MARISDASIRAVIDATDMVAIVGTVLDLKRAGTSLKGLCPFHSERTASFHVERHKKLYHCYGCGAGGDVVRFVQETRGLTFVEAIEYLAEQANVELEREGWTPEMRRQQAAERSDRGRLLELAADAQQFFRSLFEGKAGAAARAYADQRGLTAATIVTYGVGAAGDDWSGLCDYLLSRGWLPADLVRIGLAVERERGVYDRFRSRLMFPIYTGTGDLVAFGGRDLTGNAPGKYINSPEVTVDDQPEDGRFRHFYKKGDLVFGLWQAREAIRRHKRVILVEGNLDVMTLVQAGIDGVVCAMGTALTENQAKELRRFTDRVVVVYDGDKAGRAAARKAIPVLLAAGLDGVLVWLPEGQDPDSLVRTQGADAFIQLASHGAPLIDGYLDDLLSEWDGSVSGKSTILQQSASLLDTLADPIARDMARKYMEKRLEVQPFDFGRYMAQLPKKPSQTVDASPDDAPDDMEVDVARIVVLHPQLASQVVDYGIVDYVRNKELRMALRELCDMVLQDPSAVNDWANSLPAGHISRLVASWRLQDAGNEGDAQTALVQALWRLQARALKVEREVLKQQIASASGADKLKAVERLQVVVRDLSRLAGAGVRQAGLALSAG